MVKLYYSTQSFVSVVLKFLNEIDHFTCRGRRVRMSWALSVLSSSPLLPVFQRCCRLDAPHHGSSWMCPSSSFFLSSSSSSPSPVDYLNLTGKVYPFLLGDRQRLFSVSFRLNHRSAVAYDNWILFFFSDTAASAGETADDLVIGGVCVNVVIFIPFA